MQLFGDATLVNSGEVVENLEIENDTIEKSTSENQNVINTSASIDNYFVESKLTRDKMYSQMIESYQKILESSNVSETQKQLIKICKPPKFYL